MPTDATEPVAVEPVADLVLSAEVARAGVRQVTAGTVRIGKRVVTETRTVTVQVRREELYLEHAAAPDLAPDAAPAGHVDDGAQDAGGRGSEPIVVLVLHEEIAEVVTRVVPVERVAVFLDRVEGAGTVNADLRHEEVALTEDHSRG